MRLRAVLTSKERSRLVIHRSQPVAQIQQYDCVQSNRTPSEEEKISQSFRDLLVWQRAMQLTESIYRLTQDFPRAELYGLTSQIRRCAASVPSNIAEGQGKGSHGEFRQFLCIARGSTCELQTQLESPGVSDSASSISSMKRKSCRTKFARCSSACWIR
jgi:four helix bundle protein